MRKISLFLSHSSKFMLNLSPWKNENRLFASDNHHRKKMREINCITMSNEKLPATPK